MKILFFAICILSIYNCQSPRYLQQENVKLAKPRAFVEKLFFYDSTYLSVNMSEKKFITIFETETGTIAKYVEPITIKESTTIGVCTVGAGFISSDTNRVEVIKLPQDKISSIHSDRTLDDQYGKGGLDGLIDHQKGKTDINKGWLGYMGDTVIYDLYFDKKEVKEVIVSSLSDHNAWIFNPLNISVYCDGKMIGSLIQNREISQEKKSNIFNKIRLTKINTDHLNIQIIAPAEIPAWHPGSGNKPWIFIDEILIY